MAVAMLLRNCRPNLGCVVDESSHMFQSNIDDDWERLGRPARYSKGSMGVGVHFRRSNERVVANMFTDTETS